MDKEIILKTLFTETGKINSAILRRDWFIKSELYKNIVDEVPFAKSISEKIYCIVNDIKIKPVCPVCNGDIKFGTFQSGYKKVCNKMACIRSVYTWKTSSTTKKKIYKTGIENLLLKYRKNLYNHIDPIEFIEGRKLTTISGTKHQWVNIQHISNNTDELCSILKMTENILPIDSGNLKWGERFYIIYNKLSNKPKCIVCENPCHGYNGFVKGYSRCCCNKCTQIYSREIRRIKKYKKLKADLKQQGFDIKIEESQFKGLNKERIDVKCNICNSDLNLDLSDGKSNRVYCNGCYGKSGVSFGENKVLEYVISLGFDVLSHDRKVIPPKELDIFIPSKNVAIEFNGLYWHSDESLNDKKYHLNKTNMCKEKGIQLLHIFDYEWNRKNDIVKSIIKAKLHIFEKTFYARKCSIRLITTEEKKDFLNKNHLQGNDNSQVAYGLISDNEIVACMTFGKRQITRSKSTWELIRFCSKLNSRVIGGASKLLTFFEKNNRIDKLITYADLRYCWGPDFYLKLGFIFSHASSPNYWYFNHSGVYHRINFQKHKLKNKLKVFDPSLTEWENMKNNGWDRIWDCGNMVFVKKYCNCNK